MKCFLTESFFLQGQLRINPKNYQIAYIPSPVSSAEADGDPYLLECTWQKMINLILSPQDDTRDIFLDGIVARNRALDGDIVVVQVLPQDQWKVDKYSLF